MEVPLQAFGSAAHQARYFLPWTWIQYRLTDRLGGETVYFPYLPLNEGATLQHVLERAKLEYKVVEYLKVGAGYGGYKFGDFVWQLRPFLTATLSTGLGNFEIWIQKLPGASQSQLRYSFVY